MATAKKRGAPASASKAERPSRVIRQLAGKLARENRRKVNSEEYRAGREALKDAAKRVAPASDVKKDGRVFEITPELVAEFEDAVILGVPVSEIAQRDNFPSEVTLWRHIANEQSEICRAYARGKQIAVAKREELIEEIARTPQTGVITVRGQRVTADGDVVDVVEHKEYDMLGHRQLLIDTHKWALAHIKPKKHGRQPETGSGGVTPQLQALFDSLKSGPAE
jgi:hypothetical protein